MKFTAELLGVLVGVAALAVLAVLGVSHAGWWLDRRARQRRRGGRIGGPR